MAGEDAAKAAEKPAEAPDAAKELTALEEDDEFEEFESEGASCHPVRSAARRQESAASCHPAPGQRPRSLASIVGAWRMAWR
jgi:hypothetical protein